MTAFSVENENGIAVVTFDLPGEPVNKLTAEVMDEFAALLTRLGEDGMVRGVVLISGKPDNFIAGFFLTWAYLKGGSLAVPVVLHALGNLCAVAAQAAAWHWMMR